MKHPFATFCLWLAIAAPAFAVDIVNDDPNARCEYVELFEEVRVYRDPSLFLADLQEELTLRKHRPRRIDDIVRTSLNGKVAIIKIGKPYPFKNFSALSRLYEKADPRLKSRAGAKPSLVQDIQVCSEGAENSAVGFVVKEDFEQAKIYRHKEATLPPSVNEIPVWREGPTDSSR